MRRIVLIAAFLSILSLSQATGAEVSDAEIRQLLIRRSISGYPGNCPCPYSLDRAGRRCGARSAHSKAGGYTPLCFPEDVTEEMIAEFKKSRRS
jgi:hypothetical protein